MPGISIYDEPNEELWFSSHDQIKNIFQDENPESALEAEIDGNLRGSYPIEDVFKVYQLIL